MSRILNCDPKIRNVQTLVPKNAISYHMSPPYNTRTPTNEAVRRLMNTFKVDGLTRALTRQL